MHRPMLLDQFLEIGFKLKDTEDNVVFLGTQSLISSDETACKTIMRDFLSAENRKLLQISYQSKVTWSHVLCVSYCHADPQCHSVNYNIEDHLCELNNATRAQYPDDFITHYGSVYFDADPDTTISSGPQYSSCQELLEAGHNVSGIYTIFPAGFNDGLQVYCNMDIDGQGWMVIQRRQDGSVDFYCNWVDYQIGFGDKSGEFWLGNDNLRTLTESAGPWKLKIEIVRWDGEESFAEYGHFKIDGDSFRLEIGSYKASSTAGDSLEYHNGMMFTTKDKDNDLWDSVQCAATYKGGWWYNHCYDTNLNGMYYPYESTSEEAVMNKKSDEIGNHDGMIFSTVGKDNNHQWDGAVPELCCALQRMMLVEGMILF
ncbi:ficolin-3-like [Asterias amurensis]|uniref:ficolin-3-like n=1 Tax=Asterias amurensis TaxID=7602 RepID=UPI003AB536B5